MILARSSYITTLRRIYMSTSRGDNIEQSFFLKRAKENPYVSILILVYVFNFFHIIVYPSV